MIRRVIERLSRGRVLEKHLPADVGGGKIFVSPDAALQFWKRGLEKPGRDLFDFAKEYVRAGSVVWDVGANVGLFAFAAAHFTGSTGTVVAVEPDLFCAELMARSRAAQTAGKGRVVIFPMAVGDSSGVTSFNIAGRGRSSNFLASLPGSSQTGGVRESQPVPIVTLDQMERFVPAPSVLKIDVETAEAMVLRGGREILARHRPVILCEVSGECRNEVTKELRSHGYRIRDWDTRSPEELLEAPWMTLALPGPKA